MLAMLRDLPGPVTLSEFCRYAAGVLSGSLGWDRSFAEEQIFRRLRHSGVRETETSDYLCMLVPKDHPVDELVLALAQQGPGPVRALLEDRGSDGREALPPRPARISALQTRIAMIQACIDRDEPWLELTGDMAGDRYVSRLSQLSLVDAARDNIPPLTNLDSKTIVPAIRALLIGSHGNAGRAQ